ncbi:MAG: tetratricopeptide repeat protein [Planctomycetes bacterium]|nr:tetratricopeptide repeat protein [Planctomycetota bacterium]
MIEGEELRCPTCGARQPHAPECRRCRCDLSLLLPLLSARRALHAETLRQLHEGRPPRALAAARRLCALSKDADAARLLAVCYLLLGRFQAALDVLDTLGPD